eukprot:g7657.t1
MMSIPSLELVDVNHCEADDCILAIYTDNVVATAPDAKTIERVKDDIRSEGLAFTESDKFKDVLGVTVDITDNAISLGQEHYISEFLKRFNLENVDPRHKAQSPYRKHVSTRLNNAKTTKPFRQLLGCLLW